MRSRARQLKKTVMVKMKKQREEEKKVLEKVKKDVRLKCQLAENCSQPCSCYFSWSYSYSCFFYWIKAEERRRRRRKGEDGGVGRREGWGKGRGASRRCGRTPGGLLHSCHYEEGKENETF